MVIGELRHLEPAILIKYRHRIEHIAAPELVNKPFRYFLAPDRDGLRPLLNNCSHSALTLVFRQFIELVLSEHHGFNLIRLIKVLTYPVPLICWND